MRITISILETYVSFLSCNQLQGMIPATLAELTFLGSLNLSNNNLLGRILYEPHLDTFGEASFSGNSELCGPSLQRNCVKHALEACNDGAQTVYWWESWKAW